MDIPSSLAIVTLAALVHASFQLSVSVLTLLSSHAIGAKRSHAKVLRMTFGFVSGSAVMTILSLAFLAFLGTHLFGDSTPELVWAIVCGLLVGIGIAVWIFYYRHEKGTALWIPRGMAKHLSERSKATTSSAEAFSLGLTSVLGEILFVIAPLAVSALVLIQLPGPWQLVGIGIYAVVSLITLFSVWVLIGSGHKLSDIQKWRENNKRFLQFAAGSALAVLGFFVYVYQIIAQSSGAA